MILIPAIDIYQGRCVRLFQGSFDQVTYYDVDVDTLAKRYSIAGATWLHLVNLDGAKDGTLLDFGLLRSLCQINGLKIQCGGGFRDQATIQRALQIGPRRVVIGSLVLTDPDVLKNYRPVSNLSYISKIIEKIVSVRLKQHLSDNDLNEKFQSAYRKQHSTESALLRVYNDIVCSIDNRKSVVLVLLDLSAAFDTIDQPTLLERLEKRCGITGTALKWFESYLSGRTQCVTINSTQSAPNVLDFGVPQGSVLGPILFTTYTSPLGDIIREFGHNYHLYADDTQLYVELSYDPYTSISDLEICIDKIRHWMHQNFLKLNDDKSETIVIGHKDTHVNPVSIGSTSIVPSKTVRNLGVYFDSSLNLKTHVSNICKTTNFHLYNIGKIRPFINFDTTKMLINAFFMSRIDYCNSLLYKLPEYLLNRLQKVQNKAARIVSRTKISEHITPILHQLHWLPVKQRISFKMNTITYNCLTDASAPAYLRDLIKVNHPTYNLRSSNKTQLARPATNSKFGERAFVYAAPNEWNKLPLSVQSAPNLLSFKKCLKTELFKFAFSS